jgi:hypothetical protein
MKAISILRGSTIRAAKPSAPFGYLPDVIVAVAEHYKFVERPTDLSQLITGGDAQQPAIFRHGKVDIEGKSLVIEELQVFTNGIIVATPNDTVAADLIADDIFRWANDALKIQFEPIKPTGHLSQLEIQFERDLPDLFSPLRQVGNAINKHLDAFWDPMPPYELTALQFGLDPTKAPKVNPGFFKIERRIEMPFELGFYFCEASMTSRNHMLILGLFEQICLNNFVKD